MSDHPEEGNENTDYDQHLFVIIIYALTMIINHMMVIKIIKMIRMLKYFKPSLALFYPLLPHHSLFHLKKKKLIFT